MLVCHSFKGEGHRQWDCPRRLWWDGGTQNQNADKQSLAVSQAQAVSKEEKIDMTGHHRVFVECLIGEPIRRDACGLPTLEEVRRGLWQKFPALNKAELWYHDQDEAWVKLSVNSCRTLLPWISCYFVRLGRSLYPHGYKSLPEGHIS